MLPKKKEKHYGRIMFGSLFLVVGFALIIANISIASENRVDIMEGIVLIIFGGYLLGSLAWS